MPKRGANSNRRFWMFYSRYFVGLALGNIEYTGLGAAGGTYVDILTGVTSSTATVYSDIIQGGSS